MATHIRNQAYDHIIARKYHMAAFLQTLDLITNETWRGIAEEYGDYVPVTIIVPGRW